MPSLPTSPFRPTRLRAVATPRRHLPTGARTSAHRSHWSASRRRWRASVSPRGSWTFTAMRPT
eukprot:3765891-Lingulodinium_polyedra.AAC.1